MQTLSLAIERVSFNSMWRLGEDEERSFSVGPQPAAGTRSCFRTRTKGLERERIRIDELDSASDYALIKKLVKNRIDAIRRDLKMYKYKGGSFTKCHFLPPDRFGLQQQNTRPLKITPTG